MDFDIKLLLFVVTIAGIKRNEATSKEDIGFPSDPYISYLMWPHLNFIGIFRADTSTLNNIVSNYNPDVTRKNPSWNSKGSNEWTLNAKVSHMCFADGSCSAPVDEDSITVTDAGTKTFAKLVDLDTQAQFVSEIWGWKIRVGNYFSGHFNPAPFKYMWTKMTGIKGMLGYGAVYQSELLNVEWSEGPLPRFFKQLKEAMGNIDISHHKLSMRLNMDMMGTDAKESNFTTGRITGTIGLLGAKSPAFFTFSRSMKTRVDDLQQTFFYVDERNKKVFIDFGNSLPINQDGSMRTSLFGNLYVALPKEENPKLNCSDELMWIGEVDYKQPEWYQNTSGIQSFPVLGSFSPHEMTTLQNHPLLVVETTGYPPNLKCKKVLLAEASDGVDIHPYNNWAQRKNPGDPVVVEVFATKFGKPLSGVEVKLEQCNSVLDYPGTPKVGQPDLDIKEPIATTNNDGVASFKFVAKDPQNNRGYIDGQLYPFLYSIKDQGKTCDDINADTLVVIRIFDSYFPEVTEPTWLDHVYPVFKQYADLYPVMTYNFVDLGNYYDVLRHRKAINATLSLPVEDPNYMPVSRDLSKDKTRIILQWLSKEKPLIGDPSNFYTVENLRKDLQTAMALEHATIPTYLTALASIKNSYNLEIQEIINNIVIQEMMHMALVANILNAVEGEPSIYHEEFIPKYPSRLPGGVQPNLVVPIEKLSLGLVRNIFMKIEQPEVDVSRLSNFKHVFSLINKTPVDTTASNGQCEKTEQGIDCKPSIDSFMAAPPGPYDPMVDANVSICFNSSKEQFIEDFKLTQLINILQSPDPLGDLTGVTDKQAKPKKHGMFPSDNIKAIISENTIGRFYNHILNALGYLTDCGKNNSIFTGNRSKQVNFDGWSVQGKSIEVFDYNSSIAAIQAIVEQGEGSSPCNPDGWFSGKEQLSHYYLFYSVAEKREIDVFPAPNGTENHKDFNCSYYFAGPKIPFDPSGVWPMVSSPRMSMYQPGSKAHRQAVRFNKAYTRLLKSLDKVFNGYPGALGDAIGCMYSVDLHLKQLVKTPIDENGDPLVGPNAGPTFEFAP